jgi:S-adenosylmethionine synthetase
MFEKVNPAHPDKVADRIAGALVDLAYAIEEEPRIAVEVLLGHGTCHVIAESSVSLPQDKVDTAVFRIAGGVTVNYVEVPQDVHLAKNQSGSIRCGDNGIFKGMPVTQEQKKMTALARQIYDTCKSDGKYILDGDRLIICQSNVDSVLLRQEYPNAEINPLGDWTGGSDVDSGATNRKLGSDMGDSVTGGGLHGKDLSKADVSVNIYAWLKAQETGKPVELCCAIGDNIDRLVIDGYWVGHTKAWEIPGTEDMKPYIDRKDKIGKWLFGTVGFAAISAVLSGIMALALR